MMIVHQFQAFVFREPAYHRGRKAEREDQDDGGNENLVQLEGVHSLASGRPLP